MASKIILGIMNGFIAIITLYLIFIYIKSRSFRSYPCYLNIFLSVIIFIDNILRLLPVSGKEGFGYFICYFQAFALSLFDKLMLTTMTVNSFMTYVGVTNNKFYEFHIKGIFWIPMLISILISLILSIIFIAEDKPFPYDNICYVSSGGIKEQLDTVVTSLLAALNFYFIINLILYLSQIIKEIKGVGEKLRNYSKHYYRILISLFIQAITFLTVILIIGDSLFISDNDIDLFYVIIGFIVDLFYTLNSTVLKESMKLLKGENISGKKRTNSESSDEEGARGSGYTESD